LTLSGSLLQVRPGLLDGGASLLERFAALPDETMRTVRLGDGLCSSRLVQRYDDDARVGQPLAQQAASGVRRLDAAFSAARLDAPYRRDAALNNFRLKNVD